MTSNEDTHLHPAYPVAIVGGGPVGLPLSLLLSKHGIRHIVFERRPITPNAGIRGITP